MREAKSAKKDLTVIFLDIANAFGAMSHQLISTTLKRANVPDSIVSLIESYYSDVQIRFTTKEFITEWQRVEKGIITGCTLSVVLFAMAMTMLVMSAKSETKGPYTVSGQQQVNARLFMDDITTTTETVVQTRHLLRELGSKLEWGKLKVKPEKCRSLIISKGKLSRRTIEMNGEPITSITEKPVRYLGKTYNVTLNEHEQIDQAATDLRDGLKKIEKSRVPGRYKCWMVQHMLLPRIMWPLTVYNVPMSKVEELQGKITTALKRWMGLPKTLSSDTLYSKSTKVQLPYRSLVEEFKATKARTRVTFEDSKDKCIRNANIEVDGGRKWKSSIAVKDAKSRLRTQDIVGIGNKGREGLGLYHRQYYGKSTGKEKRSLIVEKVREMEEESRVSRITTLRKQGASMKWEVPARKLSHQDIVFTPETKLQFLMKSVYDLLPTPANKNVWFNTQEYSCKLCAGRGTLNHILNGCRVALQQGRYRWRHDKVLKVISYWIEEKRKLASKVKKKRKRQIEFVKAGGKEKKTRNYSDSYLDSAKDWRLLVDLGRQLKIPAYIATTSLRPDMIIFSEHTRQIAIIELTVPSEDRIGISAELKRTKYAELEELCRRNRWVPRTWTVEVGSRGFAAGSAAKLLGDFGYSGREKKSILRKIAEEAEYCSQKIWKWSHHHQWGGSN